MNALRHVTYRERKPWIDEDSLLEMSLGDRIKYVRTNLHDGDGKPLTQPKFAKAVGVADGHHGVVAWEKRGTQPRESTRRTIANLTPYQPAVFSRPAAEKLVQEMLVRRLAVIEAQVSTLATSADLERSLDVVLEAIRSQANLDEQTVQGWKKWGSPVPDGP